MSCDKHATLSQFNQLTNTVAKVQNDQRVSAKIASANWSKHQCSCSFSYAAEQGRATQPVPRLNGPPGPCGSSPESHNEASQTGLV